MHYVLSNSLLVYENRHPLLLGCMTIFEAVPKLPVPY